MQNHLKSCGKEFECMVCDQCFETKKILSEHHLNVHGYVDEYQEPTEEKMEDDANRKTCPVCQVSFVKDSSLLDHLLKDHVDSLGKKIHDPSVRPNIRQCRSFGRKFRPNIRPKPNFGSCQNFGRRHIKNHGIFGHICLIKLP